MIQGQTSAWNHTMNMRVPLQGLSPCMQNTEKADVHPKAPGISGHFEEGGTGGLKQQGEQQFFVLPHQGDQVMGHTENDVKVLDRQ